MEKQVRVRFAPSPTGYLHVGGARTALYNWLFARHAKGKFILRIEDTDVERSTTEAEDGLLRDLRWLGLDWDEGPGINGPHGPYRQSERGEIYRRVARQLIANGAAYYCFCSEEMLEDKKRQAEADHQAPHYDGTCRNISPEEAQKRVDSGEPAVIRVKVPQKDYWVDDLVRERVEWKSGTLGDFIILRSSGIPVYNFCVVVDDADMEISHVIRAEEHLPNTHRQLILYEAMGKLPPLFAHVSLILGPDKTKLSKRHGATSVGQFAEEGFLSDAMANFLVLLGWSEGNDREVYSRAELIEKFSLERINKSPAVFDHAKLLWMNGTHLRAFTPEKLSEFLCPVLRKDFPDDKRIQDPVFAKKLVVILQNAVHTLSEVRKTAEPILNGGSPENDEAKAVLAEPQAGALLQAFAAELSGVDWQREALNAAMKSAGKKTGAKGKSLFMPIRVKLTGNCHGPDLIGIIELLGREETIKRLS